MKIFDEVLSQAQKLTREVRTLPAQLDAISACRDAGVVLPSNHRFESIHQLDAASDLAFAFDGRPMDRPTLDRRVKLKNAILAAGMVGDHTERPVDERAVQYA